MKILHVITCLNDGGAEAVLYRLCTTDQDNCHRVVSLMDLGKYGPLLVRAGLSVDFLNMPRGRVTPWGLLRLWRILREEQPDVVQTWMYHADLVGGMVARLAGTRSICWGIRQSNLERGHTSLSTILVARLCAFLSRFVPQRIIACAQKAAQIHQGLGYAANKFVVISNGYQLDQFKPDRVARLRLRTEWGVDESIPLLGMVARFDPQKDHKNLLQALALLKKNRHAFRCVLVGRGLSQENGQLLSWLNDLGLQGDVILLGQRNDVPDVMNALDVHVLSSLGEAFPNVLAEAMACGVLCVTTDVGDAALIVGDTGWVVPPKDPDALTQAIAMSLNEMQDCLTWRQRQQVARHRIVEQFSIERMVKGYRTVWKEAMESATLN